MSCKRRQLPIVTYIYSFFFLFFAADGLTIFGVQPLPLGTDVYYNWILINFLVVMNPNFL